MITPKHPREQLDKIRRDLGALTTDDLRQTSVMAVVAIEQLLGVTQAIGDAFDQWGAYHELESGTYLQIQSVGASGIWERSSPVRVGELGSAISHSEYDRIIDPLRERFSDREWLANTFEVQREPTTPRIVWCADAIIEPPGAHPAEPDEVNNRVERDHSAGG